MNVYDSERMTEALAAHGYAETPRIEDADLVVLNTCHIREKAAEKVYSDLGRVRAGEGGARAPRGRDTLVAVAGCVAQAEGAEIIRRAPVVDLVVGPQSYHRLPELIARARARRRARSSTRRFPRRTSSRSCPQRAPARARHRVSHRAGRLRQVLHVLRRALYARHGVFALRRRHRARGAPSRRRAACARSRCSARTSTPITARARTARPWSLAQLIRHLAQHRWPRAAALHDEPSARHERRSDRRARRGSAS